MTHKMSRLKYYRYTFGNEAYNRKRLVHLCHCVTFATFFYICYFNVSTEENNIVKKVIIIVTMNGDLL